jgi:3-hydroxyisobutyrate dehydrogenase
MRIGIAGLGRMGHAIALRLHETGHELVVWNRTPGKAADLATEAGATLANTAAELADAADVVISMLTDAAALDAVYRGPTGLLAGDLAGKLVIDMSTVQPATEIAIAEAVRAKGAAFVECPVGGTTGPARSGTLLGLAGGTEADVARARLILDKLCRRLEHVGPVGSGASMKLAINLPLLVFYQALGEAMTLCRHLGQDPAWLMAFFADTSGGANVLKVRGAAIAEALSGGHPAPTFDIASIRKDLRTMVAEAKTLGTTLPLAERTLAIYDEAAAAGWDNQDGASLPAYWPGRTG